MTLSMAARAADSGTYAPLPAAARPDDDGTKSAGCMAGSAPPYERRRVLGAAALACAALLALGVVSSYAVMIIGATIACAFGFKALVDVCKDAARGRGDAPRAETASPLRDGGGDAASARDVEAAARNPLAKRVLFLDNVKVLLTAIVIGHHATAAYAGQGWIVCVGHYRNSFAPLGAAICTLNQSYFMCMFFFISGYFTPASCARKGRAAFFKDRCRRLGLPLFAYLLGVGPLAQYLASKIVRGDIAVPWFEGPGPTWFLSWLLMFSALYAAVADDDARDETPASKPTLARACAFSLAATPVQVGLIFLTGGSFLFMPVTFGSLPYDVAAFAAGCAAERGGWLDDAARGAKRAVAAAVALSLALIGALYAVQAHVHAASKSVPPRGDDGNADDDVDDDDGGGDGRANDAIIGGIAAFAAVFFVVAFHAWLRGGAAWLDFTGPKSRRLARAAYAAYVIHPPFVLAFQLAWITLLRRYFDEDPRWRAGSVNSSTRLSSDWFLWAGWAATVVGANLTVWPAAYLLARAPLLKRVL